MKTLLTTLKSINKLGLFAILITTGILMSFRPVKTELNKSNDLKRTSYEFKYVGPANPDEADIQDISNWQYDEFESQSCTPAQQAPCRITVDLAYVDVTSTPVLKSTINLLATENNITHTLYVSGSDDSSMDITNRAN